MGMPDDAKRHEIQQRMLKHWYKVHPDFGASGRAGYQRRTEQGRRGLGFEAPSFVPPPFGEGGLLAHCGPAPPIVKGPREIRRPPSLEKPLLATPRSSQQAEVDGSGRVRSS